MKKIVYFKTAVSTSGSGFLNILLEDDTEIKGIPFNKVANFNAVCSMLQHKFVYYKQVNGGHKFISSNNEITNENEFSI